MSFINREEINRIIKNENINCSFPHRGCSGKYPKWPLTPNLQCGDLRKMCKICIQWRPEEILRYFAPKMLPKKSGYSEPILVAKYFAEKRFY